MTLRWLFGLQWPRAAWDGECVYWTHNFWADRRSKCIWSCMTMNLWRILCFLPVLSSVSPRWLSFMVNCLTNPDGKHTSGLWWSGCLVGVCFRGCIIFTWVIWQGRKTFHMSPRLLAWKGWCCHRDTQNRLIWMIRLFCVSRWRLVSRFIGVCWCWRCPLGNRTWLRWWTYLPERPLWGFYSLFDGRMREKTSGGVHT